MRWDAFWAGPMQVLLFIVVACFVVLVIVVTVTGVLAMIRTVRKDKPTPKDTPEQQHDHPPEDTPKESP